MYRSRSRYRSIYVVATRHVERTNSSQTGHNCVGKSQKKACLFQKHKSLSKHKKTYDLGGINGPLLRGWNPVTHEDRSLRAGAPGLGEPRMSGEAGYLSPASPLVLQVLWISLIGVGRVATIHIQTYTHTYPYLYRVIYTDVRGICTEQTEMKNGPCRLLEELLLKEKEYQQVLKATLQQRSQDLELARVRHRPSGT